MLRWLSTYLRLAVVARYQRFVQLFNSATGAELGAFPLHESTRLLGFSPDGQTLWTSRPDPPNRSPHGYRYEGWAVPTAWPPAWLLAVTVLAILLVIADWYRSRRRHALPAVAAVGYPAEQGGAS